MLRTALVDEVTVNVLSVIDIHLLMSEKKCRWCRRIIIEQDPQYVLMCSNCGNQRRKNENKNRKNDKTHPDTLKNLKQ